MSKIIDTIAKKTGMTSENVIRIGIALVSFLFGALIL